MAVEMDAFWDVTWWQLLEAYKNFRVFCCFDHQGFNDPDGGGSRSSETVHIYQTTKHNITKDSRILCVVQGVGGKKKKKKKKKKKEE